MANWSNNNRACTTLWTSLYSMQQLTTNFADSGALKMSDLTFYNPLSSADLRAQEANVVADQLDNIFRNARGAKYEQNVSRATAISDMVAVLTDADKQVQDLASAIDTAYRFWGETN